MTNHWADLANSTCFIIWGANPAENHPASIAHIGRARFPQQFFGATDPVRAAKQPARLIVIDPRRNRTASLIDPAKGDAYIRIRPGTDIALANGLVKYMIETIEGYNGGGDPAKQAVYDNFKAYLNWSGNGTFYTDGKRTVADEAIVLNGTTPTALANANVESVVVKDAVGGTAYAAGDYTVTAATGEIARTVASTIPDGATVYVTYRYRSGASAAVAVAGSSKYTDARFLVKTDAADYQRATINVGTANEMSDIPVKAADVDADPNTVYNRLKAHVAPYTLATVADICGCTEAEIQLIGDAFIENSRCSSGASTDPRNPAYRATAMLYAMGITQHTCGGANVKSFAVIQTLMGNMGRAGGGINALRGIHNVQGSTDMGLLYGNIPAYSGNPGTQVDAIPSTNNAFGKYMDALWGTPLSGTGGKAQMNGSYDDAYRPDQMALQQRGFYNMTLKWFGNYAGINPASAATMADRTKVDACYSLWPKGNGDNHIEMFRKMGSGSVKAAVVWGQNPAVTEPNQGAVRTGLYNLDLLVVVDMFETETAGASRKSVAAGDASDGITILIPTAAHTEKAGSSTNSGRTLQWRYKSADPAGNTKDDTELLLRLAKALDTANAFQHITDVWTTHSIFAGPVNVYEELFGKPYSNPAGTGTTFIPGTTAFTASGGTVELVNLRTNVTDPVTYTPTAVTGSEWVAECVYREMCTASASGGTIWIYTNAYATGRTTNKHWNQADWGTDNRAKSRDNADPNSTMAYPGWGYAWLVNRRVLYNNNADNGGTGSLTGTSTSEVPGDVNDFYMGPDSCSRIYTSTESKVLNYSRWYRTIHRLNDRPSPVLAGDTTSPHYAGGAIAGASFAGRFPAHVEPYETPRQDLLTAWGRNTGTTFAAGAWNLVKADTPVAGRDLPASQFPLVLTTIRCVEHFQGGPITRNNWWNVELEPEPWIEINLTDARKYGIVNGDMVKVISARTEGLPGDMMANYGLGFRARVGSGLSSTQKVGPGVVAIPWHWGDKGLSTGSRANDVTIDAMDANTTIPEYKACLCRIEKM